ncbi:uncharacterized protein, partial [Miscanthus floridulus]|uniref:uncharacterized protein n=1 Tax=Miscanthus floridulus TaxID=154761 RepID=UPI00345AF7EC
LPLAHLHPPLPLSPLSAAAPSLLSPLSSLPLLLAAQEGPGAVVRRGGAVAPASWPAGPHAEVARQRGARSSSTHIRRRPRAPPSSHACCRPEGSSEFAPTPPPPAPSPTAALPSPGCPRRQSRRPRGPPGRPRRPPEDLHDTRTAALEPSPKPAPSPPITSSTSEPPPPRPSGHLRRRCPPAPPGGSRPSVLSGTGTHAATTARGQAAPTLPYDEHDYSIRTFTGHSASVMSLDFHPNKDDLICSCDGDNEIRFWSIKHGNVVRIFKGGSTQLRFQPRYGGYLATASDNVVSILDVETQTCVRRFESHTKGVDSVCWDPTGEYVVSVSEDSVKVWSLNDESFVNELNCSGRKFTSCTFHPTYPSLLIIGCYQSLELWDMSFVPYYPY